MRPGTSRALVAGLLLALAADPAWPGTLIERTVAFVNKRPVLLSDVLLTRALLPLDEAAATDHAIDESLMFEEASRLLNEPQTEKSVASAVLVLEGKAGPAFSAAALRRKALIQLAIANYIELRLKSLVRVEDDEVRKVFNERMAVQPQSVPFSEVAPSIREALEARSLDEKIEEWVVSLRTRAEIRRPATRP